MKGAGHYRRKRPVASLVRAVSKREAEVLDLLAQGLLDKHIAERLGIKYVTVKQHTNNVRTHCAGARLTRVQLAQWWAKDEGYLNELLSYL